MLQQWLESQRRPQMVMRQRPAVATQLPPLDLLQLLPKGLEKNQNLSNLNPTMLGLQLPTEELSRGNRATVVDEQNLAFFLQAQVSRHPATRYQIVFQNHIHPLRWQLRSSSHLHVLLKKKKTKKKQVSLCTDKQGL